MLYAGDDERLSQPRQFYLQAELLPAYNNIGFSNMFRSDAAELAAANPASIVNFKRLTFGMAFDYRTEVDLYQDIKLGRSQQWYPVSAAIIVPVKFLYLGLVYQNKYSKFIDYGKLEISTIEEPEGTGEFINPTSEANMHSLGAVIGSELREVLLESDRLAFAVQLSLDYFNEVSEFGNFTGSFSDFAQEIKLGLIYNISPVIGLGFLYEFNPIFKGTYKYKPELVYPTNLEPSIVEFPFADKMAIGMQIRPIKQLSLSTGFEYVLNEHRNSYYKNALNYSLALIYRIHSLFDVSAGMYDSNQSPEGSYSSKRDAVFFNLGIRKRFRNGSVRLEVYDSHFFTDEMREQTIVKLGFNIAL